MTSQTIIESIAQLRQDVIINGGSIRDDISFRYEENDGVGIVTQANLLRNTVLMMIPYNLCLSTEMIACDPFLSKLIRANPGLSEYPDEILAIAIMYASNPNNIDCEWSHHIKAFPLTLNSTLFWTDEELNELKNCNVYHLTKLMQKQMTSDWECIHLPFSQEYDELNHSTLELYQWALSMVYSRAIGITRRGKYIRCIPPLIDLANHSLEVGYDTSDTFEYDEESNVVKFYTTIPRQAGDQCFASYGHYSNAKLAHTYGFIIPDNPIRAVDLWTRLTPASAHYPAKLELMNSLECTSNQTYDFTGTLRENFVDTRLLMTIRIIQCDEADIAILTERVQALKDLLPDGHQSVIPSAVSEASLTKMISVRNELATYTSLRSLIVARMKVEEAEVSLPTFPSLCLTHYSLLFVLIL